MYTIIFWFSNVLVYFVYLCVCCALECFMSRRYKVALPETSTIARFMKSSIDVKISSLFTLTGVMEEILHPLT